MREVPDDDRPLDFRLEASSPLAHVVETRSARAPTAILLLRVDTEVSVADAVAVEAAATADALVRLAPEPAGPSAWRDYHRRFLDRYGIGAIVPLLELLHSVRRALGSVGGHASVLRQH